MKKVLLRSILSFSFLAFLLAFAVSNARPAFRPIVNNVWNNKAVKDATYHFVGNTVKRNTAADLGKISYKGFSPVLYTSHTELFSYTGNAVQNFTIPANATNIRIHAYGAAGGSFTTYAGGLGAVIGGSYPNTYAGVSLSMVVGQRGLAGSAGAGGGGGSFVYLSNNPSTLLIAAGAGGGAGSISAEELGITEEVLENINARFVNDGYYGLKTPYATGGDLGQSGNGGGNTVDPASPADVAANPSAGGGAGWLASINDLANHPELGGTFHGSSPNDVSGALGGNNGFDDFGQGGYGGGGATNYAGGGGGGGYSGGGAGAFDGNAYGTHGGGGGSFFLTGSGITRDTDTYSDPDTDGKVIIEYDTPDANNPLTPGSVGSNQNICSGATPAAFTSTADASGGNGSITYQWQSSTDNVNFANIPGAVSSVYAPGALTQTTFYKRLASTANDAAVASNTLTVTVNGNPGVGILSSGPTLICAGSSVTLQSNSEPGLTLSWNPGGSATSSITVSSAGTYTLTGTNASGCSSTATVTVSVVALPNAPAGTNASACSPNGVTISAAAGAGETVRWYDAAAGGNQLAAGNTLNTNVSGTFYAEAVNGNGCASATRTAVTATIYPAAVISGTPSSLCIGGTAQLSGSGVAAANNAWVSSNPAVATVDNNGKVTATGAGNATITYTTNGGCTANTNLFVSGNPGVGILASGSTAICAGSSVTLNSNSEGGLNLSWNPGGSTASSITVSNAGTYTLTGTNQYGCSSTASVTVSVVSLPNAPAGTSASACAPNGVNLTATAGAGETVRWYDAATGGNQLAAGNTLNTNVSGTFYAEAVNGNGCVSASRTAVTATINPLPNASILGGTINVCQNDASPTITFKGVNGTAPYTFSYQMNGGVTQLITTTSGNTVTLSVPTATAGTFVYSLLSVKDGSSTTCTNNAGGTATVIVHPTVTPVFTQVAPICSGSILAALPTSSNNGITGTWSPALNNTTTTTYTFTPNPGQCATSTTMTITVNANPTVSFVTGGASGGAQLDQSVTGLNQGYYTCLNSVQVLGQSFKAGKTGKLVKTSILYQMYQAATNVYTFTADIISGDGFSGTVLASKRVSVNLPYNQAFLDINFDTPADVTAGQMYTLRITPDAGQGIPSIFNPSQQQNECGQWILGPASSYPDGHAYVFANGTSDGSAFVRQMKTYVADPTTPSAVCVNASPITLAGGTPAGGVYSGTGVSNGVFNPVVAGVGTFPITYTYTDANGCSGSATASITVNALPAAPQVTVVNNCDGTSLLSTNASGSLLWSNNATTSSITVNTAGTYTVTTKVNGCTSAAGSGVAAPKTTPVVTISAVGGNITSCPGTTITLQASGTADSYQWYKDAVMIPGAVSNTFVANANGVYTLVVTTNGCSSAPSNSKTLIFQDITAPVAPILPTLSGECSVTVTPPTANDNCAGSVTGTTNDPLVYTSQGEYDIHWTFTDNSNNSSTAIQHVSVKDVTPPVFTNCPADINIPGTSAAGAVVTYAPPAATDNCSVTVTQVAGLASGANFPLGTTTVTYEAVDAAGNTATCSFKVTVSGVPPVITCPGPITVSNTQGLCGANVSFVATETTGVPASVITYTENGNAVTPGSYFTVGTHTITATATNAVGSASCSFTIVVTDSENPVLTGVPANTTVACNAVPAVAAVTATDNCTNDPAVNFAETIINQQNPGNYQIQRVWTVTDAAGNTTSKTQIITVEDHIAPVVNCPSNISVPATAINAGMGGAYVSYAATASDNCGASPVIYSIAPGSFFPIGTTTVTVTSDDGNGNTGSCSFSVTVTCVPPVITVKPANQVLNTTAGTCGAAASYVAEANGIPASGLSYVFSGATNGSGSGTGSGSVFNKGVTTVTITAANDCGNDSYSFTITVEDHENPVIVGLPASAITVNAANGRCDANVNWDAVTVSDNCPDATLTTDHAPGSVFAVGTTTVHYTARDASGNTVSGSFDVVVTDNQQPEFTCPADITVTANTMQGNTAGYIGSYAVTDAIDNCGIQSVSYTIPSGSFFPVGNTPVTVTVTDIHGNKQTCTFHVIVDCSAPVFTTTPSAQTVNTVQGQCSAPVTYAAAASGMPAASLSYSFSGATTGTGNGTGSGSVFNKGITTVTITAANLCGSVSSSFTINVEDHENPVIVNLPSAITVPNDPGQCGAKVSWDAVTVTDNCPDPVLSANHISGEVFPVGTTTVVYTAKDASGNTVTGSFTITVADNENPVITVPADITHTADAGSCSFTFASSVNNGGASQVPGGSGNTNENNSGALTFVFATATDNCGIATVTGLRSDNQPLDAPYPVGETVITWTAMDAHGHTVIQTQKITITDDENPTITAPAAITIPADNGSCNATNVNLGLPATADNCAVQSTTNNAPSSYPMGTTTVTWTVTDIHGNTNTASQTITVVDNQKPTFTCPGDITVAGEPGKNGANVSSYTVTDASDNCGNATVSYSINPGYLFPLGVSTPVTITVKDAAGNETSCTIHVMVTNNPPVANPDVATTNEDTPVGGNVLVNDADIDGHTLSVTQFHINGNDYTAGATAAITGVGTVVINADGSYLFAPAPNYNGPVPVIGYDITDGHGGTASSTLKITIIPVDDPSVIKTKDKTVYVDQNGHVSITVGDIDDGSYDPDGIASLTIDKSNFDCSNTGLNTVTLTLVDVNGQVASAPATVTVLDIIKPVISCPASITVSCSSAVPAPDVASVTASDNCAVTVTFEGDQIINQTAASRYTVLRTYKATDPSGNFSTCVQTITVNDVMAPVPVVANLPVVTAECAVTLQAPKATDNCAGTITATTTDPVNYTTQGTYTVNWKYSDGNGNESYQQQTVIIKDVTAPVVSCPASVTAQATTTVNGQPGAFVTFGTATASDNCGPVAVTYSAVSGSFFPVGTTAVTVTATDAAGNTSSCTFNVTVNCAVIPVTVTSLPASNVYTGAGPNSIFLGYGAQSTAFKVNVPAGNYTYAWSGTGISMLNSTNSSSPVFTPVKAGSYTFTVTVTNATGCTSTGSITICVTDIRAFTGSISHDDKDDHDGHYGDDDRNDDDDHQAMCNHKAHDSADCPHKGHNHTCDHKAHTKYNCPHSNTNDKDDDDEKDCDHKAHSAKDCPHKGHNHKACDHKAHNAKDCEHDKSHSNGDQKVCDHKAHSDADCSHDGHNHDDCDHKAHDAQSCPHNGGNKYGNSGNYKVYICHVPPGNPGKTITLCISVNAVAAHLTQHPYDKLGSCDQAPCSGITDNTKPVIDCADNVTVSCGGSVSPSATGAPTATDNSGFVTITFTDISTKGTDPNAAAFYNYTITRTWRATDPSGNYTECKQLITVQDQTNPVISCPGDITIACAAGNTGTATATDNSGGPVTITYTDVAGKYYTTRTWKAMDVSGNYATCTQKITVNDNVKPVITCPGDKVVACGGSTLPAYTGYATATDNCSGTVTVTYTDQSCDNGVIKRTWKATDAAGNYSTCVQTITKPAGNPCALPYPIVDVNYPRSSVIFNESEVLRMIEPGVNVACGVTPTKIKAWYNDEHAMTLGVRQVIVKSKTGTTTTNYPVTPYTGMPATVTNVQFGTTADNSSDQSGNDVADYGGRPLRPVLYISDITNDPNNRAGDWQHNGTPYNPTMISGSWKSAVRVVDKTKTPAVVTVIPDADPAKNNWKMGIGADAVPAGLDNEGYGTEVAWDINSLGLLPGHTYRVQVIVHDGDQNKVGGDAGQACAVIAIPAANTVTSTFGEKSTMTAETALTKTQTSEEELKVTVMPNPSTTFFTLKLESRNSIPVNLRVLDARGRVIDARSKLGANSNVQIGHNYSSGTYYAELIQGNTRKVVQLIKGRG